MQRRRKRGLPHMTIFLLTSGPKNGVELMDGVQSITRGWWRPTPGSIYPMLKEMSDQGLVRKRDDGKYELTQKGRQQAEDAFGHRRSSQSPQTMGGMIGQVESFVSYMEDVKSSRSAELEPHRNRMKSLAERLSRLAGEGETQSDGP